jgi:hypothetical protein
MYLVGQTEKCVDVHVCTPGAFGRFSVMCELKRPLKGALQRVI